MSDWYWTSFNEPITCEDARKDFEDVDEQIDAAITGNWTLTILALIPFIGGILVCSLFQMMRSTPCSSSKTTPWIATGMKTSSMRRVTCFMTRSTTGLRLLSTHFMVSERDSWAFLSSAGFSFLGSTLSESSTSAQIFPQSD